MASVSWMAVMLLLITCRESKHCDGLTVDPPNDLVISDLGHFGHLQISWSPPAGQINETECSHLYQLEYFNSYSDSWSPIRTFKRTHTAQFDLMKDVRVRVYTLLRGPCTNDTLIKSSSYTEVVQKPPSTGVGTPVQDFVCVYHNMKYVECNWGRSPKLPANSQQHLYFWHKELEQAEECPTYVKTGETRSGCNFTESSLPEFTDINFCVNGSSQEGPLKPAFVSLQITNQVKPGTTEKLDLRTDPDAHLDLRWNSPAGRVPAHCLEWKVEHNQEGPDGKITSQQILTNQKSLKLSSIHDTQRNCFRVRSKLSKYCANKGFWSEWSPQTCQPEKREVASKPWDIVPVYVYIAFAILAILVLSLCVRAVLKVRSLRDVKKPDALLANLFARSSVVTVTDA
ncbi:hypothetical protein CesoFtcFv8_016136 [Champsocephalus esox]|uniref:Fibronectin type-III domain-containing protein n=1 Tax=Champsocephalus esox TaxID=159716 RepID=A0AAN8BLJ5_9TELE|nr:hypothetical protein CesoFtcFv8_016136 [Champsocephalus esox]